MRLCYNLPNILKLEEKTKEKQVLEKKNLLEKNWLQQRGCIVRKTKKTTECEPWQENTDVSFQ